MSNNFIGLIMIVTLTSPSGAQLKGVVSGIEPGRSLTLRDVTCPATGKYISEFTIKASEIQELVEAQSDNVQSLEERESKAFDDPAILSVGKRPNNIRKTSPPINDLGSKMQVRSTEIMIERNPQDTSPTVTVVDHKRRFPIRGKTDENEIITQESQESEHMPSQSSGPDVKAKNRAENRLLRPPRAGGRKGRKQDDDHSQSPAVDPSKPISRSKGWRQTPLLEPTPSFQPYSTLKQKGRRREDEEWGTDNATDVQELGDFDFQGGLAKFDKSSIFNQFLAEDGTADEDRLVTHNRIPKSKSGTAGGKNLHYSENVLGNNKSNNVTPKIKTELWIREHIDVSEDQESGQNERAMGRVERKLSIPRRRLELKPSSEKGSTNHTLPPSRTLSAAMNSTFFTLPSNRRCEVVSPLQMLNLENIADNELGLSEDMMTENAGRGIAEVAFAALGNADERPTKNNNFLNSTVIILAGNNKKGFRAVAAARHILNHKFNVALCVLGPDQESDFLVGLKRQIKIFRCFGGTVLNKDELFEHIKLLEAPPDLIIDGLLGLTISFEELRLSDQSIVYELITWANRSKASVLAIDVPTGIDPMNGEISIVDGTRLYLHANYVVAMGAPKKGLLEAMAICQDSVSDRGRGNSSEWQLFVADIGLGAAAWKIAGTKIRRGIEFEGRWVLEMRYQRQSEK
ncbi:unnamed protein product [Blumeria hordei]|uniref:Enhancer of mRNA-decapping protein 3 n=1 Tax=Blumeria hordei TaxID=2867405 RepID=A0A383US55_BLUHO|nr:unnamed protein product [Blumeria hordei]